MDASQIPIDIHYNKLLDWLLNRRHCNAQWQSECLTVRHKINNAIQDMPEHPEIKQLLAGTYINYFHCVRIIEILRDTEAASKNIFGRYSSQRMKDWQEVVRLYEKDDIYLGEAAQLLARNVNYEIPNLKKQIAKCQQAQTDCSRKQSEYGVHSKEYSTKYSTQCKQMGIQGKHVKKELMGLVKDLPTTYQDIADRVKSLKSAVDYYSDFITFTLNNSEMGEQSVLLVKYISSHGNTTTMEYKTGVKPTRIVEHVIDYDAEEIETANQEEAGEIDWGTLDSGGIDYNITADSGDVTAQIDFGDEAVADNIDWGGEIGIEIVDSSIVPSTDEALEVGVARGDDALTILDNTQTRDQFTNELIELQCFFSQRLHEMKSEGDVVSGNQLQNAPSSLELDLVEVQKLLALVDSIHSELNNSRMQDLMLIRSSPRYVDRLTEKLKSLLSESDKMASWSRLMVTRREEARQEESDLHPRVDLIREKMKDLKKQIESEISKKYKNRPVNIMGEINTI